MAKLSNRVREIGVPFGVLVLVFTAVLVSYFANYTYQQESFERSAADVSQANAYRAQAFFEERFRLAEIFVREIEGRTPAEVRASYQTAANAFLDQVDGLQAVNFIDSRGKIAIVTPFEPNKKALNVDLSKRADLVDILWRARDTEVIGYSGVLELLQGGTGMAAYIPIFTLTDEDSGTKVFRGWLNVVYRIEDALGECFEVSPPEGFGLRVYSPGRAEPVYSQDPPEEDLTQIAMPRTSFKAGSNTWQLELVPTVEHAKSREHPLGDLMLMIGLALSVATAWLFRRSAQQERAARENRRSLEEVLNSLPFEVYIKDLDGRYIYDNHQQVSKGPLTHETFVGHRDADLLPADRARNVERRDRAMIAANEPTTDVYTVDNFGKQHHVRVTRFPLRNSEGEMIAYGVVAMDLTKERELLERLQESEERISHLYNKTPVMLHSIDPEGRLVSVSDFWLESMGYQRDEVLGRKITDFLSTESAKVAATQNIPRFLKEGEIYNVPYEFVRKDGSKYEGELSAVLHHRGSGEEQELRSSAVIIDVSDRNRAQAELNELNAELEERVAFRTERQQQIVDELKAFTYSVSHDFRAPMRAIEGFAKILREDQAHLLDDEGLDALARIEKNVHEMQGLIDDLLRLSRISAADLREQRINLTQLCREVFEELRTSKYPDYQGDLEASEELVAIADRGLVKLLVENLLDNAIKYSAEVESPKIRLEGRNTEGIGVYSISDNGIGFDAAHSETVLEPFTRLENASVYPGTGVGLAIASRIAVRHGGWFRAESEVGKGATFTFSFGAPA